MANLFVEIYPYHFETLYPYHRQLGDSGSVLLHHPAAEGKQLFDAIECEKTPFTLRRLVREIRKRKVKSVHVNSVGVKLRLSRWKQIRFFFQMLALPLICKLLSCRVSGIVHEADQFFKTDHAVQQRNRWFQILIGRWYIRAYDQIYVLSRDVQRYLADCGTQVDVLSTEPLSNLVLPASPTSKRQSKLTLAWIGSVNQVRRDWKLLLDLDPTLMDSLDIEIDLICDISAGQGKELLRQAADRGISHRFGVRDYRPDDLELLSAAYHSDAVLCFYSSSVYDRVKVSGSRHIADAFGKPYIARDSAFRLVSPTGELMMQSDDINACLAELASVTATTN